MIEILHLTTDHPRYAELTALLRAEPLATEWWRDAESEHEDGIAYMMALVNNVPAAWAGWRIERDEDGTTVLRCRNSYERRGAGRELGLYAQVYRARHEQVVLTSGLPGLTYLYREPLALHEADGWVRTPWANGISHLPGLDPHAWWELRRPA